MDLLNLSRPWDCESFPKSKTICYGGGGGGGGSVPKIEVPKIKVPEIKIDTPKIPTLDEIKETVTRSDLGSGAIEDALKRSDLGSGAAEDALKRSDLAKASEKIKKEGSNAVEAIKEKGEEFKQYALNRIGVKDPRDQLKQLLDAQTTAVSNTVKQQNQQNQQQGPGGGQTIGQGGLEGLKGGGSLASSNRSRIRQNKRKLRVAKA